VSIRVLGKAVEALEVLLRTVSRGFLQRTVPSLYPWLAKEVLCQARSVGYEGERHPDPSHSSASTLTLSGRRRLKVSSPTGDVIDAGQPFRASDR
jgi:hypothetical protein